MIDEVRHSANKTELSTLEQEYEKVTMERKQLALSMADASDSPSRYEQLAEEFKETDRRSVEIREEVKSLILEVNPAAKTKDSDYVFLTFILNYLPNGLIGLLIAVILSAAMSSTSSELNALASTSSVDFYKRLIKKNATDKEYLILSRFLTLFWGVVALSFALMANNQENLIEAINIIGSIFYGTILGIFLVAFFFKFVKGTAVFVAALLAQGVVFLVHLMVISGSLDLGYLWYNVIGFSLTILVSLIIQILSPGNKQISRT